MPRMVREFAFCHLDTLTCLEIRIKKFGTSPHHFEGSEMDAQK
jgi:hypothetical protein